MAHQRQFSIFSIVVRPIYWVSNLLYVFIPIVLMFIVWNQLSEDTKVGANLRLKEVELHQFHSSVEKIILNLEKISAFSPEQSEKSNLQIPSMYLQLNNISKTKPNNIDQRIKAFSSALEITNLLSSSLSETAEITYSLNTELTELKLNTLPDLQRANLEAADLLLECRDNNGSKPSQPIEVCKENTDGLYIGDGDGLKYECDRAAATYDEIGRPSKVILHFEINSSKIEAPEIVQIARLGECLNSEYLPDVKSISIRGFTEKLGVEIQNPKLSEERAQKSLQALKEYSSISPIIWNKIQFEVKGIGTSVPSKTPLPPPEWRRVEMDIKYKPLDN